MTTTLKIYDKAVTQDNNTKSLSVLLFGLMIFFSFFEYDGFFQMQTFIIPAVLIVVATFFELLFYRGIITINRMYKLLFLFLVVNTLGLFLGIYPKSIEYVLFYFATAAFYFSLTYKSWNIKEVKYIVNSYYLTGLITAILLITVGVLTNIGRYSFNLLGVEPLEVNFLAALLCTPAMIALKRSILYKSKLSILVNSIVFLTIMYGVFLTGSRAALVAIIISAFPILIYGKKSSKNSVLYKLIGFAILLTIIIALITWASNYLPEDIFQRLFLTSYEDNSNERRLTLWVHSLEMYLESPALGFGHDSFPTKHAELYGNYSPVHNTYLTILFNSGLVGFGLFICFLYYAIKDCLKMENRLLMPIVLNTFITSFMINAILSLYFWINIIIVYQCCNILREHEGYTVNDII